MHALGQGEELADKLGERLVAAGKLSTRDVERALLA